ncbi:MAG: dephospho-CoA kinase [Clostridia bacterium]|jgi:dephospho-CoA kinase|nr:dephospho-CoA kinase [Clostridia bacterium]
MQVIGVSGISGSGKTTVSREICDFREAEHINVDRIVRENQKKGKEYYKRIVETFGKEILLGNSEELDRVKLAKMIFSDKEKKSKIDELTLECVVPEVKVLIETFSRI